MQPRRCSKTARGVQLLLRPRASFDFRLDGGEPLGGPEATACVDEGSGPNRFISGM